MIVVCNHHNFINNRQVQIALKWDDFDTAVKSINYYPFPIANFLPIILLVVMT